MTALNLPSFEYTLRKQSDKLFILDILRKKYLVLTPEEWVRQHFIHFIINVHHYPRSLIRVEGGLTFNRLQKRSDIVVFGRDGQPWMLIECKAPEVKLTQAVVTQAGVYNHTLKAKHLVITNGMTHYCCEVNWDDNTTTLLSDMPQYG